MPNPNYQNLDHLLASNKRKQGEKVTHTRIGDRNKGIFGGSYSIPDELMPLFWKLYYRKVWRENKKEYLTEQQNKEEGGPLLVDLDMKFDPNIKERRVGLSTISDIIELYGDCLQNLFTFDKATNIPVYVFQKDNPVFEENYTKDGLHLILGIHMKHTYQQILRNIVIEHEKNITQIFSTDGLECTNSLEDIFDNHITQGGLWQVLGSRKPGCEAYKLSHVWNLTIHNEDVSMESISIETVNIPDMLPILSVKNNKFPKHPTIKEKYKSELQKLSEVTKKKNKKIIHSNKQKSYNVNFASVNINLKIPKNSYELDNIINHIFEGLDIKDLHIKEIHDLVMVFDETYYDPFSKWLEVGWALHNTDDLLFWTWVKFSSKSDKFLWDDIPGLITKWNKEMVTGHGKSWRSIDYWCRTDFPDEYEKIRRESKEKAKYNILLTKGADTDIAILSKYLFKGEYSCTSMKHHKWYRFFGHRWQENECGVSLRSNLSSIISGEFTTSAQQEMERARDQTKTQVEKEKHVENAAIFNKISIDLKTAHKKNNIMTECAEQFYDHGKLAKQLDQNKMLLGFENGIYDFQEKAFRAGTPEDCVSFSTGTEYIPYDKKNKEHKKIKDEIDNFMLKVFPNEQLRNYMWAHAASALIGVQRNQKFNIYTGCGSNGKSIFVNLMNLVLGDYADKLNIALVTQKRKGIGGPTPEIAKLKGKRYVSMDEPSAGDQLNEGIMKQMVGGDEMEGREMYGRHMIKFYPQFELVCCTNRLFEINSNDKGTWRRIRQVDFKSEFLDPPDYQKREEQNLCNDAENPIYIKDDTLEKKIPEWVQVFTALLIEIVNKTQGKVEDCPQVIEASLRYQEKQDFYALFCKEKIRKGNSDDKIKKTDIRGQFQSWYQDNYQAKPPKSMDLYDQLDKRLGKYRKRGWWGYKIIYDTTLSEDEEEDFSSD